MHALPRALRLQQPWAPLLPLPDARGSGLMPLAAKRRAPTDLERCGPTGAGLTADTQRADTSSLPTEPGWQKVYKPGSVFVWPSLWDRDCSRPRATPPGGSAGRIIPSVLSLAPGGVWQADRSPGRRCALTAPFHRCRYGRSSLKPARAADGCVFSVPLSVGSPRPDVIRHRALWSPDFPPRSRDRGDHPTFCRAHSITG